LLGEVAGQAWPLVLLEAPHRLSATLADLHAVLGDRRCVVARELTKLHEEVRREPLSAALAHFTATAPRGEFTIVVAGAAPPEAATVAAAQADQEQQARTRLAALAAAGLRSREAVALVTEEVGLPRRRAYELWLELTDQG
jgi:16S rRNA (cytidine1402-2'-O)-methyltransferase